MRRQYQLYIQIFRVQISLRYSNVIGDVNRNIRSEIKKTRPVVTNITIASVVKRPHDVTAVVSVAERAHDAISINGR